MYVIIKHGEWRSVHEADWNWQRRLIEGTILCMDMTCRSRLILGVIRSNCDRYSDEASCPGGIRKRCIGSMSGMETFQGSARFRSKLTETASFKTQ